MHSLVLIALIAGSFASPDLLKGLEDPDLFEGDIILTPAQKRAVMRGDNIYQDVGRGSSTKNLWPGGIFYYEIDPELEKDAYAMDVIRRAMEMWESTTCIRFVRKTTQADYVYFYNSDRCGSSVGKQGGEQEIELSWKCYHRGMIAHEIGHALGFYHEQSRPDRDDYVTIIWDAVNPYMRHNFLKFDRSIIDSLGTPYDYASIMHYDRLAFGNGRITIEPKEPGVIIGRRSFLSKIDIQQMNLLYKCPPATTLPPTTRPPPTQAPPAKCYDVSRYCTYWAGRGECASKPIRMAEICKKSCNFC